MVRLGDEQNPYPDYQQAVEKYPNNLLTQLEYAHQHKAWQDGVDAQFKEMVEWLDREMLHNTISLNPLRQDRRLVWEKWEALKAELEEMLGG